MNNVNDRVVEFLEKSYKEGRLVHGYLFFGGEKSEKLAVAKKFACTVLEVDEIGRNLIETEQHANVHVVRPEGKNIKKEQIILLKTEIGKKSVEDRAKIYIIEEAEKMSISATNSLLKFLEEPAPNVYIILIATSKEVLLPTIISRTVNLGFRMSNLEKSPMNEAFLTVIKALENGEVGQVVVAKNPDIFKEQVSGFLDAYQAYLQKKMDDYFGNYQKLQQCIKKLRALDVAKRDLLAQMNVALCLDKLWFDFKTD